MNVEKIMNSDDILYEIFEIIFVIFGIATGIILTIFLCS